MKDGLYSVHIQMGDGVKGRASGIIVLRGGGRRPQFLVGLLLHPWRGNMEGPTRHQPAHAYRNSSARPVFAGREVTTGF